MSNRKIGSPSLRKGGRESCAHGSISLWSSALSFGRYGSLCRVRQSKITVPQRNSYHSKTMVRQMNAGGGPRIFGVIPAAGHSRRMGQAKLLLPLGSQSIIARVLEVLRRPEIGETIVVVRRDDEPLLREVTAAGGMPLQPAVDPPEMRDSVALALRWLREHRHPQPEDAWLLLPADHPLLDPTVLDAMLSRWQRESCPILIPTAGGKRGHPVLFRWTLADEVDALPADAGLNQIVRRHAAEVVELELGNPSVLIDLDTPQDYARLLSATPPDDL
ncbi:MAG: NTP transferase domain-containing protein [Planctomycetales bacterium]